jgi:hypothetical protein
MNPVWVWSNFVGAGPDVAAFAWFKKRNKIVSNIAVAILMNLLFIVSDFISHTPISKFISMYSSP